MEAAVFSSAATLLHCRRRMQHVLLCHRAIVLRLPEHSTHGKSRRQPAPARRHPPQSFASSRAAPAELLPAPACTTLAPIRFAGSATPASRDAAASPSVLPTPAADL